MAPDSPILHLNLLVFALQTALTTAVCIVEYRSWPELNSTEKSTLGGLYIPYFVFGKFRDEMCKDELMTCGAFSGCDGHRHVYAGTESVGGCRGSLDWEEKELM